MELLFHYSKKLCDRYRLPPKSFSPEFLEALTAYNWPGNVRELINTLEWAIAAARQELTLYPKHLPVAIRMHSTYKQDDTNLPAAGSSWSPLKEVRDSAAREAERQYLSRLMTFTRGDIKEASRISGLSLPQMYAQLKKHHLSIGDFKIS